MLLSSLGSRWGTLQESSPSGGAFAGAAGVCTGCPGLPRGIVPRRGGAERGSRRPRQCGGGWSRARRGVSAPLQWEGRAKRGRRSAGALRVRRAGTGELPQGHCAARCPEAAPNSILPSQDPAMMSSLLPSTPTPSVPPPDTTSSTRPASPGCTVSPPAEPGCRRGWGRGQGLSPARSCLSRG